MLLRKGVYEYRGKLNEEAYGLCMLWGANEDATIEG